VCLEDSGRYREVIPLLERELGRLGSRQRFETLLRMTHAHLAYGAFHLAKQVAGSALSICDADGSLEKNRADVLNLIGIAELWSGAPARALDAFLEAYRLSAKDDELSSGGTTPDRDAAHVPGAGNAIFALNVGSALRALQRSGEAAEWISRAFALRKTETEGSVLEAIFVGARAELEEHQGELQRAEASYKWSLETYEKQLPPFHPRVVRTRVFLARTLHARGLREESRRLAQKAVDDGVGYFLASHPWMLEGAALARDE
jgi:tetratricopeptide (TPR) repeat protein